MMVGKRMKHICDSALDECEKSALDLAALVLAKIPTAHTIWGLLQIKCLL
jgi:hypothetical protein